MAKPGRKGRWFGSGAGRFNATGADAGGRRIGVAAVTVSVIAHGPDNSMILLGCVGVSAVKQ